MKLLSVYILTTVVYLWLWLAGGRVAMGQAHARLTHSQTRATATPAIRLLKLPLPQKIDSILHHLRTYSQASTSQRQRYKRELGALFAPSGYISVHLPDQSETRLSVSEFLARFGKRSEMIEFAGAEVVHYGQSVETAGGKWQTMVTTYRNAKTFTGNKPQATDIATVMTPVQTAPPATNYWQIFNLNLSLPTSSTTRQ